MNCNKIGLKCHFRILTAYKQRNLQLNHSEGVGIYPEYSRTN